MSEEEKKAVEDLSKKAVFCNYEERDYPNMICFKKDMLIVLNLIEKLQKENEELKNKLLDIFEGQKVIEEETPQYIKENYIPKQKVKEKIEELQEEYNKLDEQIAEYINDVNKDLSKYYENKERIGEMQMLAYFIDNLQELIEESEEK